MLNTIPHKFTPRDYQLPFFKAMDNGCKRALLIWHRRTGKDKSCFNYMIKKAVTRVGNYFYIFPTYSQGKKALRDNIDIEGFKTLNHIPKEIIESMNGQDMLIKLVNGSTIQVVGTDGKNIDRLVGTNPVGVVYSEYALQNPRAWDLIRPILAVNGGWAVFNSTPRGKNHLYDMFTMSEKNEDWFCQKLTIDDTGILGQKQLDEERQSGMDEDLIQQEYYCSFDAAIQGAYYAQQFLQIEKNNQICRVPIERNIPVLTFWDLGRSDTTSIWFVQVVGSEVRLIDYYENSGEPIIHYSQILTEKGYNYGSVYLPHDGDNKSLQTGMSVRQQMIKLGWSDTRTVERPKRKENSIEAVRTLLSWCYFDKERCHVGINALKAYRKERDEKHNTWKKSPLHDWSSHASDAFSYLALTFNKLRKKSSTPSVIVQDYSQKWL